MNQDPNNENALMEELTYLRGIVESYNSTDSRNIKHGIATIDVQNILNNFVQHFPAFVYVKDKKHRFIMANDALAKHMGVKRAADLIGKTDHDFYPRKVADLFQAVEKEIIDSEVPIIDKDEPSMDAKGEQVWILTSKVPFRSHEGSVAGLIGVSQNISKLKRLTIENSTIARELKEAKAKIEKLEKSSS